MCVRFQAFNSFKTSTSNKSATYSYTNKINTICYLYVLEYDLYILASHYKSLTFMSCIYTLFWIHESQNKGSLLLVTNMHNFTILEIKRLRGKSSFILLNYIISQHCFCNKTKLLLKKNWGESNFLITYICIFTSTSGLRIF